MPKGDRQSRPPVLQSRRLYAQVRRLRGSSSGAARLAARLVARLVAQQTEGRGAAGYNEHAVPQLALGLSSTPTISMTQIGPEYG
eukprot:scaffold110734_cov75-Phaeocystis_antarctica.AAC.5